MRGTIRKRPLAGLVAGLLLAAATAAVLPSSAAATDTVVAGGPNGAGQGGSYWD